MFIKLNKKYKRNENWEIIGPVSAFSFSNEWTWVIEINKANNKKKS